MPDWQAVLDLDMPPARTRIVVAMSGGVDSSVVAASLARAGYEVVGITLQLYDQGPKKEPVAPVRIPMMQNLSLTGLAFPTTC